MYLSSAAAATFYVLTGAYERKISARDLTVLERLRAARARSGQRAD